MWAKLAPILLNWIYKTIIPDIAKWCQSQWHKFKRAIKQKAASKKQQENVEQGKPRDEQTKKDESDYINS